jgi:methylmalonyl-CoA mutase N-terminal domain/subunit
MSSESEKQCLSLSGSELKRIYTPDDVADLDYERDLGDAGQFPFTRGVYPTMYRGRLWTMRMFAGFGTAEETNRRFKRLLEEGETGLSVAFDMPTLMGYDSDHPKSLGEVGRCGVAIDSVEDMDVLFRDIPLDKVTVSMTINCPAAVLWAFYLVVAERRGISWEKLGGTIQNDILKEYIAQKEWAFPIEPSVKLVVDTVEFAAKRVPKWHPISISGYHIREAGSTAQQELNFTLLDGLTYVERCLQRGLKIDDFAPQLSFFFDVHSDFFEEVAKLRAARRIWARLMKERYHPQNPKSLWCRFHCQTAGVSLTAQQPMNNVVRVALQALAAVLGGCQSLHTNSLDETYALPTEEAALLALRTQQIIAHETGVANVIDPLGGSYYVEAKTNEFEQNFFEYLSRIEGDALADNWESAIAHGVPQREIANSAAVFQRRVEEKDYLIIGVNEYVHQEGTKIPTLKIAEHIEREQVARLRALREERHSLEWTDALEDLKRACHEGENIMPYLIACARAQATVGEIMDAMREVFGEYREPVWM